MFTVTAWAPDFGGRQFIGEQKAPTMRAALRLAWELIGGIQCSWAGIRRGTDLVGEVSTNYKGELDEAAVHAQPRADRRKPWGPVLVTPLNVRGPIFAGVFAG